MHRKDSEGLNITATLCMPAHWHSWFTSTPKSHVLAFDVSRIAFAYPRRRLEHDDADVPHPRGHPVQPTDAATTTRRRVVAACGVLPEPRSLGLHLCSSSFFRLCFLRLCASFVFLVST